jgi:hypothetical protein
MKPSEYQLKIQQYNSHEELTQLWEEILADQAKDWAGGMALQYLIVRAFELEGAEVKYAFSVRKPTSHPQNNKPMEEIDGVVYIDNGILPVLIESKDKDSNVNNDPISKMGNQLSRRPKNVLGAVFSSKDFTPAVYDLADLAHTHKILLWNSDDIDYCLRTKTFVPGMIAKYHHAVETGQYDANLKTLWGIIP